MKKSPQSQTRSLRRHDTRRKFLGIERLEERAVFSGASPAAVNDLFTTLAGQALDVDAPAVLSNDTDAEGDALTAQVFTGPAHGKLLFNPDGSFQYTPDDGFTGMDSFTYAADDGTDVSNLAAVNVQVGENTPVAQNDVFTIDEDSPLVVAAPGGLANDSDADGDPLTASVVAGPLHGTLEFHEDGSFAYQPEANFHGLDGFSYLVSDGTHASHVATVTIKVNAVNDMPVANNEEYSTDEDTPLTVDPAGVLTNDTDADGDKLTPALVQGASNGEVTLNPDGSFTYTPNPDYNGVDGFSYSVNDGTTDSYVAAVTINVNAVNDAPVAADDAFSTDEDTPLVIATPGVLTNDSDVEGDSLAAELVAGPANGTVALNPDGSFTYTPNADFNGVDEFSYSVSDGTAVSNVAKVAISVSGVNDGPIANDEEYTTDEDAPLTVDPAGVLTNDTDADGDTLTPTLVQGAAHGQVTLNPDGSFTYAPAPDFNGTDGFSYSVNDGSTESNVAQVTVNVTAVNDAPVTAADDYTTDEDTPLVIAAPGVLTNDSDVDGDSLAAELVSGPANGTVALSPDGSFVYTPNANFNGTDSFTYAADDGTGTTEGTVNITVNPVSDAGATRSDFYNVGEDNTFNASPALGVLANDSNPQGLPLTAELIQGPTHGTLALNPDGSFSYTPSANYFGEDSFTYVADNGIDPSVETTATILVQSINDAPVAADDVFGLTAGTPLEVAASGVIANDSDIEGDPLSASLIAAPEHGAVVLNPDGSFSYTPEAGYSGADSFQYQLNDGIANSNVAMVTLNIAPPSSQQLNERPTSANDHFTSTADQPLVVSGAGVLENDIDPEGQPLTTILATNPDHGTVALNGDGSFVYTPVSGFTGRDSFMYRNSDGVNTSPLAAVTIDVNAAPSAVQTPTIVCSADEHGHVLRRVMDEMKEIFGSRHHALSEDLLDSLASHQGRHLGFSASINAHLSFGRWR